MPKRNKQWERRAGRNRESNSDAGKLAEIQLHLKVCGFNPYTDKFIKSTSFTTSMRAPDLEVFFNGFRCFVELDGKVHGSFEFPTKRTITRNADYERAKNTIHNSFNR